MSPLWFFYFFLGGDFLFEWVKPFVAGFFNFLASVSLGSAYLLPFLDAVGLIIITIRNFLPRG